MSLVNSCPLYMLDFINDLQVLVIKSLKRKGSCIKRGKLLISLKVENYLIKHFKITKRLSISNLLNALKIDQQIVKNNEDLDPIIIKDFKIKFGNKSTIMYTTSNLIKKRLSVKRAIHYEFVREVKMHELNDKEKCKNWSLKHYKRTSEWIQKQALNNLNFLLNLF